LSNNVQIGPLKLTRFERARIAGARALQLSFGAPMLMELPQHISDPIDIALAELKEGVLPMTIRRTLPDGSHQDIALFDLVPPKEK
jgi:DNA-directed RNA polymerase I, II, and III subunit RPABC2